MSGERTTGAEYEPLGRLPEDEGARPPGLPWVPLGLEPAVSREDFRRGFVSGVAFLAGWLSYDQEITIEGLGEAELETLRGGLERFLLCPNQSGYAEVHLRGFELAGRTEPGMVENAFDICAAGAAEGLLGPPAGGWASNVEMLTVSENERTMSPSVMLTVKERRTGWVVSLM